MVDVPRQGWGVLRRRVQRRPKLTEQQLELLRGNEKLLSGEQLVRCAASPRHDFCCLTQLQGSRRL